MADAGGSIGGGGSSAGGASSSEGYTVAIPDAVVDLVQSGELTWELVETSLTGTFQALLDDVWVRQKVRALEEVFPKVLEAGVLASEALMTEQRRLHFFFMRDLHAALVVDMRRLFERGAVPDLTELALGRLLSALPVEIRRVVVDTELYFGAMLKVLLSMVTTLVETGPCDSEVGAAIAVFDLEQGPWVVVCKEGGKNAYKRGVRLVAANKTFFEDRLGDAASAAAATTARKAGGSGTGSAGGSGSAGSRSARSAGSVGGADPTTPHAVVITFFDGEVKSIKVRRWQSIDPIA